MGTCNQFLACAVITLVYINRSDGSNIGEDDKEHVFKKFCLYQCSTNETASKECFCASNLDMSTLLKVDSSLELLCRESNKIVLEMNNSSLSNSYFLVEKQINNSWKFVLVTKSRYFIIDELRENTTYKFRCWIIPSSNYTIRYHPIESQLISTKALKEVPLLIPKLQLSTLDYSQNVSRNQAVLKWKPAPDRPCHHEFVWFGGDDVSDYTQREVEIPYNYTITMDKLSYNSNYSVAVMTKSSDWSLESGKVWYHFQTPSCLTVLKSLDFCTPEIPLGIDTKEVFLSMRDNIQLYNINVTWDKPSFLPDWYMIHLNTFEDHNDDELNSMNVTGTLTSVLFCNVSLNLHYQITIFAFSKAGRSKPGEYYQQIDLRDVIASSVKAADSILLVYILPLVVIICVIALVIFASKMLHRRDKIVTTTQQQRCFEEMELKSHYLDAPFAEDNEAEATDEWEIDAECLTLLSVLGRGAFGVVRKGMLEKGGTEISVAVKMLLEDHRHTDKCEFQQEMEIMKSVGCHPHIVSLIGCCTKGKPKDLRLIVEYCARGDLLSYMRTAWNHITTSSSTIHYENTLATDQTHADNKLYLLGVDETWNMQMKDLISIGLQVALGMEYLSSLHVLHRDLAARNVLICEDRTIKVSDFGLSRDVYRDNIYCKTSSGKLPIRWLALESLTHQMYTTYSDVWSFGILLWEIITLGANPYPGVQTHELLDLLLKGYRMGCPGNCSPEVYSIMMRCWNSNAKERPNFIDIRQLLENILETKSEYLNLNLCNSFTSMDTLKATDASEKSVSSERYVKAFTS